MVGVLQQMRFQGGIGDERAPALTLPRKRERGPTVGRRATEIHFERRCETHFERQYTRLRSEDVHQYSGKRCG